nr:MAG TPA: GATase1-like protein [Caudoviricetes sp.]
MIKVGIFMADGCEEIEGLTVVDIVRRAKLEIETISITEKAEVSGDLDLHVVIDYGENSDSSE